MIWHADAKNPKRVYRACQQSPSGTRKTSKGTSTHGVSNRPVWHSVPDLPMCSKGNPKEFSAGRMFLFWILFGNVVLNFWYTFCEEVNIFSYSRELPHCHRHCASALKFLWGWGRASNGSRLRAYHSTFRFNYMELLETSRAYGILVPLGARCRAVPGKAAAQVSPRKKGRFLFLASCTRTLGSGTLCAVSNFMSRSSSVLHPSPACHGGVMARGPA